MHVQTEVRPDGEVNTTLSAPPLPVLPCCVCGVSQCLAPPGETQVVCTPCMCAGIVWSARRARRKWWHFWR